MSTAEIIESYLEIFPEDADSLKLLKRQLADGENVYDRKNFTGHICGSGIVLSPDHQKILLIHHKTYDRWQQPGGHAEAQDQTPLAVAQRETLEETGASIADALPIDGRIIPLEISSHLVRANPTKGEPEHYHHDFRYVFEAANEQLHHQEKEVHGAAWFPLGAAEVKQHLPVTTERLRRFKLA